ncbi:MAG TPA: SDR family oxidoreductase [Thermoanaerobaculia bacterium]|nr:SDR family oxidoreductase [Thermoanaerobaculia bacterium]
MAGTGEASLASLQGTVVLVTGSSSGIGAAIARAATSLGARVVLNSRSSRAEGEALAAELAGSAYVRADVSREEDCRRLVDETVERFGRLDHLVNNAGTTRVVPHADLDAVTDEDWQRILGTNLIGAWYLCRAALPHLREARGSILNVTSVAGIRPTGSSIPYAVSKAALNHLTLLLANVVGPEVRVNALAPGLVQTPWTADWTEIHRAVAERAPLRRAGQPEDIAQAALGLLLSPYTTGVVVLADGGLHLRG